MERGTGRQMPHEVLEKYRFRAVELRKRGWKLDEIAEAFGVGRRAVMRWLTLHQRQGRKALLSRKSPGPISKLTQKKKEKLLNLLKDDALHYKFETPLWTCKRVQQLVAARMKEKLNTVTVWRTLRSFGLTNQTPERRALQENQKEGRKWLREEWPKIEKHRRRWQAILYFLDESGVSLIPVLGKTWAPKGKTPIVRVTNARGGFCLSSAISPAGRMVFRIEKGKVNSKTFIDFLVKIMLHHPRRKVIIIADQARPHIANVVKGFVLSNKNKIALYYLPPHSPHLNPDEKVWNHLKNQKLKAHQARTKDELKPLLVSKMRSIQKDKSLIHSIFMQFSWL